MKIISSFKDYYDFIAGYDTDPRKVFIRKMGHYGSGQEPQLRQVVLNRGPSAPNLYFLGEVWFCDQNIPYLKDLVSGLFYYDYDQIPGKLIQDADSLSKEIRYYRRQEITPPLSMHFGRYKLKYRWRQHKDPPVNVNTKFKCPILFSEYEGFGSRNVANGKLGDIRFSEFKSPQDAFTELYNWIPYLEPAMPSDPTDMSRFENKGFDKKTSFRNL